MWFLMLTLCLPLNDAKCKLKVEEYGPYATYEECKQAAATVPNRSYQCVRKSG